MVVGLEKGFTVRGFITLSPTKSEAVAHGKKIEAQGAIRKGDKYHVEKDGKYGWALWIGTIKKEKSEYPKFGFEKVYADIIWRGN